MTSPALWACIMWSLAWTGLLFIIWADGPISEPHFLDRLRSLVVLTTWLAGLIAINMTLMMTV